MSGREREFVVRFAVGDKSGARSSVWRIWKGRNKDDIYVAPRPVAGMIKGSLHATGICHFAVTAEYHVQMRTAGGAAETRQITTWRRPATPPDGTMKTVSILFAAEFLSRNSTPVGQDTQLINSPAPGEAIVVDLLFTRFAGCFLLMPNQRALGLCSLSTGEQFLTIAGRVDDFDAASFRRQFSPVRKVTKPGFVLHQPRADPDTLRGAILLPDLGDGTLRIVEIGQPSTRRMLT
jgi:hypothetical protein